MSGREVVAGPAGNYYAVLDDWQFGETLCAYPISADVEEPPAHPSEGGLGGWAQVEDLEYPLGVYPDYSLEELEAMPDLAIGQADSLKIETTGRRVWLSRMTVEDGEPCENKVSEELNLGGSWRVVAIWRAQ